MYRVAVIYDCDGWCWHYQAIDLQRFAPPDVQVEIFRNALGKDDQRRFDAILCLSWASASKQWDWHSRTRITRVLAHHGVTVPMDCDDYRSYARTRNRNFDAFRRDALPFSGSWIGTNRQLADWLRGQGHEAAYLPAGVNDEFFRPAPLPSRFDGLTVGWCGQVDPSRPGIKGFDEILEPLMKRIQPPRIRWQINNRTAAKALSREEMLAWYQSIDVFLCTSISEGTPMPPLEAMACGRAVLATDVGDLLPTIHPGGGWIVPAYRDLASAAATVEAIFDCLARHVPREFRGFGAMARQQIEEHRSWRKLAPKWLYYALGDTGQVVC